MTNVIPLVKKPEVLKIDIQMQVEVLEGGSYIVYCVHIL